MAVRVDRVVFDPASGHGSGVQLYETPEQPEPWQPRPFTTKTEYAISAALQMMAVPAEVIRQQVSPVPLMLMPPVVGYAHSELTIDDVLDTDRWQPRVRSWMSGLQRQPRQVDAVEDMWSGTLRGFNASPNPAG